ncbi:MAG: hypothetical protein COB35_11130 [Gammaproteobacteria bacterium]|nr:MAG: hypothetical protein COB35_11130 [Gammaproteobacteria bacterium]
MQKQFFLKILLCLCITNLIASNTFAALHVNIDKSKQQKHLARKIVLPTDDKFKLTADYYSGEKTAGGVLLLHDCNATRKANTKLAILLAKAGLHVFNLDFRGYGDSKTDRVSQVKIRKSAKNIKAYQNAMTSLTSFWPKDTLLAFQWLRNKVDRNKQIAIVSYGCSINYAISVAEKIHVNGLVLVTPVMDYSDKERYKNLTDIASYFINSAHQLESYKTSMELFEWSGSRNSKMQIFKGDRKGHSLVRSQKGLLEDISRWLQYILK